MIQHSQKSFRTMLTSLCINYPSPSPNIQDIHPGKKAGIVLSLNKYVCTGSQTEDNLSLDPLRVYFIFSNCRNCIRLSNHRDTLGGFLDFQCNKILLRASSVVKAMMFLYLFLIVQYLLSVVPHMAITALGCRSISRASDSVLKIANQ